jgi:glucan-binding YG repeat protein/lysophospholipase L1-like esterase
MVLEENRLGVGSNLVCLFIFTREWYARTSPVYYNENHRLARKGEKMNIFKKTVACALAGVGMLLLANIPVSASESADLGREVTNYIDARSNTVSVGVYDANSGKTYTYNPSKTYQTLSVVKMSMLANVLHLNTPITDYQNSLLTKMIVSSDNSSASTIWRQLGSDKNVQSFFTKVGMTNTIAGTGGWWGRTTTNVADQLTMMKHFAYPNLILTESQRAYGLNLMRNVQSDQRWGTGSGLPAGVSVALKNGWYTDGKYVNSVGYISGQGKNYVIAVLTTNNKSFSYGVETINTISKMVWNEIPGLGWVLSNGKWYFYTKDGKFTGWLQYNNRWYYLDSTGVMKIGWLKSGDSWYYLNSDGAMKTGWLYNGGAWYFMDHTGAMKTGWVRSAGKWYYLNSDGKMKTGWVLSDGKWFYLKSSGEMLTGWTLYKNKWYFLNTNSGVMETDWIHVSGKRYYLNDSGVMTTGWQKIDGKWYYLKSGGEMLTGWKLYKDKWYYLNTNSGAMETGLIEVSGKKYYLKDSGEMMTGWQEIEGKWYYFYPGGQMASNTMIQGYKLGDDGAWIQVAYVALGDSLASGTTPTGQDRPPVNGVDPDWGYPNYIAKHFEKSHQLLKFTNYAASGFTTEDVIADLGKEAVQQEIRNATHLTIDIGLHDLIPLLQTEPAKAQDELPIITEKISTILGTIDLFNPNVKVYVMGYYNPYPYVTDPQQKEQINQLFQAFNAQIQEQAIQHGDTYVPTAQVINIARFADYIPNPQNIHLSLPGYQTVAEEFWKVIQ